MINKTVGGDRLGSGGKLTTGLKGYDRSTHDIGKVTRTSMAVGTLVPVYCTLLQKGDVLDIDLSSIIRTHPTNGPIFGSFKFQVDVFTADIRLYNKQLHNNTTGIGLKMNDILFPRLDLNTRNPKIGKGDPNVQQIAPDSLLAYLGIRGCGIRNTGLDTDNQNNRIGIFRNAMPMMAYYEIVKEYYANKQEEIGYVIAPKIINQENVTASIDTISFKWENGTQAEIIQNDQGTSGGIQSVTIFENLQIEVDGSSIVERQVRFRSVWINEIEYPNIILEDIPEVYDIIYDTNNEYVTFRVNAKIRLDATKKTETGNYQFAEGSGSDEYNAYGGIQLQEFPLSNIDDVREAVFSQAKINPLTFDYRGNRGNVYPYKSVVGQSKVSSTGYREDDSNLLSYYPMSGLCVKTYQSDRYNNWLSTTWIENINNISSVNTSTGSFTMDALNLAKKVYQLENRIAVSGGTYQDWLEAVYGEKTSGAAEMPVYRGGMSNEIEFEEVVSSSDATTITGADQPLGTLGGRGIQKNKKGGKIRVRAEEHGYLIIIASITPRLDYYQGNQWWTKLETMDDIHKPQLDNIGFQELLTDEMAAWDTSIGSNSSTEEFHSVGKQPSWTHYMTNTNEVFGNFARENSEQWMVLTRRYEYGNDGLIKDATTYIDPTKFNYPFAYTKLENQPFWVQVGVGINNRRIMSANQMPNY